MRVRYIVMLLGVAALAYLLLWPTGRTFESFDLPVPRSTLPQNPTTATLTDLGTVGDGPEDIAVASDGTLFTGIADGHIMMLMPGEPDWRAITVTYGRPLGLALSPDERWLYIADANRGLMRTDRQGHLERIVDSLDGQDLGLVDDLAVHPTTGQVFLSVATTEHGLEDYRDALLTHHGTGKLLHYDPKTRTLTQLLDGLQFANGVAITPAGDAVLVAETGGYRIMRYGLIGRDSARVTPFAQGLEGFTDGINYDPVGNLWVSLVSPRSELLDDLGPHPFWREVVYRLPEQFKPAAQPSIAAVALDAEGRPVEYFRGKSDNFYGITNVVWQGDTAYLGSLFGRRIGVWEGKSEDLR